jgi:hypothetical protein
MGLEGRGFKPAVLSSRVIKLKMAELAVAQFRHGRLKFYEEETFEVWQENE